MHTHSGPFCFVISRAALTVLIAAWLQCSAAALICYEMGHFEVRSDGFSDVVWDVFDSFFGEKWAQMEQPIEMYLPEFKNMQVFNADTGELEGAVRFDCRPIFSFKHRFH